MFSSRIKLAFYTIQGKMIRILPTKYFTDLFSHLFFKNFNISGLLHIIQSIKNKKK